MLLGCYAGLNTRPLPVYMVGYITRSGVGDGNRICGRAKRFFRDAYAAHVDGVASRDFTSTS